MQKSSICKEMLYFLLLAMLLLGGCQKKEESFLPEAENDYIFTVIGEENNDNGRTDTLDKKNQ